MCGLLVVEEWKIVQRVIAGRGREDSERIIASRGREDSERVIGSGGREDSAAGYCWSREGR